MEPASSAPPGRFGAWRVSVPPVVLSLLLSACTVGTLPHWQDSGLYLTAVKDFTVLYPPGFALYLCLCKAWTLLLAFVDFTLAVHLFSSVCTALAAGFLARAAERFTGDRVASSVAACLAAAGYTWWFSGIYAKVYGLLFALVALLLWRLTCRDVAGVVMVSGLAWAAHPSAVLLGPAILLFLVRHRADVRAIGAARSALLAAAAAVAAFAPSLVLPVLSAKDSVTAMGNPATAADLFRYLTGARFTTIPGVWGVDGGRWLQTGLYAWEEFQVVGLVLAGVGVGILFRDRREERWMLPAWVLPIVVVATLFKIEGQLDFWLVPAWMALWLVAALGLSRLRARFASAPAVAAAAGLICALGANARDLYLRGDDGPEKLGRCFLQNLDPGSVLVVSSDDALGLCTYLQTVRGVRPDVRVVMTSHVSPRPDDRWYLERLVRRWPGFRAPEFGVLVLQGSTYSPRALAQAAIVNGQDAGSPPVFFDQEPATGLISGGSVVPAGFLWKWSPQAGQAPDAKYWDYPVTLEQVGSRRGRKRGLQATFTADNVYVAFHAYEERFVYFMGEALRNQADLMQRTQTPEGFARSADAYKAILRWAPGRASDPQILYPLALDLFALDRHAEAAPYFQRLIESDASPVMKAGAWFYLGEMHSASRRPGEAADCYRRALDLTPPGSPLRGELERRLQR